MTLSNQLENGQDKIVPIMKNWNLMDTYCSNYKANKSVQSLIVHINSSLDIWFVSKFPVI